MTRRHRRDRQLTGTTDPGAKMIGLKVVPALYRRLALIKRKRRLRSIRAAALLAMERGARLLLNEPAQAPTDLQKQNVDFQHKWLGAPGHKEEDR